MQNPASVLLLSSSNRIDDLLVQCQDKIVKLESQLAKYTDWHRCVLQTKAYCAA